jgi:hypothetical protein
VTVDMRRLLSRSEATATRRSPRPGRRRQVGRLTPPTRGAAGARLSAVQVEGARP